MSALMWALRVFWNPLNAAHVENMRLQREASEARTDILRQKFEHVATLRKERAAWADEERRLRAEIVSLRAANHELVETLKLAEGASE